MQALRLLGFAALVAAAVPQDATNEKRTVGSFMATFEEIPAGLQLSNYKGLKWQGIEVLSLRVAGIVDVGIQPKSPPNVGAYLLMPSTPGGTGPLLTSLAEGTVVNRFDLQEFYCACTSVPTDGTMPKPIDCLVQAFGYRDGHHVATHSYHFSPAPTGVASRMQSVKLSKAFSGLDQVKFQTQTTAEQDEVIATVLDDISYYTYQED